MKPTLTMPELSSGNILLKFTEGIKDVATYDKDDFVFASWGILTSKFPTQNLKYSFSYSASKYQKWFRVLHLSKGPS